MNPALILIDEFGHPHLETGKLGAFSHFIYTSLVIDQNDESLARNLRKEICLKFRLGKDIKSKNLGEKYFEKRLDILRHLLAHLDFTIDILVVDKEKLVDSKGLVHHHVFYKYFQSMFVTKYNSRFSSYSIFVDKVGEEFKYELEDYVRRKGAERDLFFPDRYYALKDDISEEKLIQFADLICGSIGKIFCTSHIHSRANEIYEILFPRMSVVFYPYHSARNYTIEDTDEIDKQIRKINSDIVEKYLDTWHFEASEKAVLLRYMLLNSNFSPNRMIPTYDLRLYMSNFFPNYTEERLRLLIRDLRYEGVLIISHAGRPGYKLASCYQDIKEHFNHFLGYVIPMLNKIKILNESISENSFNKVNPLEKDPTLIKLKEVLLALEK